MKTVTAVCFLALVAFAAAGQDKYTNRYDNINVQEILNNHRLLVAYINCILDKGRCTQEGRELKSRIRDALENRCGRCTEIQRGWTDKVLAHLINHEPAYWEELVAKYDPQRKYMALYEKELKSLKA